jgi:hypothetical protein
LLLLLHDFVVVVPAEIWYYCLQLVAVLVLFCLLPSLLQVCLTQRRAILAI